MTESLIAPTTDTHGAGSNVAPPQSTVGGSEEKAASDAAALIYRGSDAEAAQTAEAGADALAEEAAPVAPETPTYEPFALPQGVEVDTAALEEAQSLFAEARLSQPQAQKLVDLYAGKMSELVQRQISAAESRQKAWITEVKNDPDLGGRRFEAARAAAQRAFSRFGTPELRRSLDELGVSNSPQLFRFFVRVGQAVSEDRYVGAQSSASRLSAAETLYPNTNNK
ncbi:MAG: hypothetical protein ABI632_12690 [Pseudolysinimonas sp.]